MLLVTINLFFKVYLISNSRFEENKYTGISKYYP